jgi:hypothetical protein
MTEFADQQALGDFSKKLDDFQKQIKFCFP